MPPKMGSLQFGGYIKSGKLLIYLFFILGKLFNFIVCLSILSIKFKNS